MTGTYAKPTVLLVGNFLSASGGSRDVCEDLALRLPEAGWSVLTTSRKVGRLQRIFDMATTALTRRRKYDIASVDVFSGPAFTWAEVVCQVLRWLGKPYILTLRGGNLPVFTRDRQSRVKRLLKSAAIVTTPSAFLLEEMHEYREDMRLLPNPLDLTAHKFPRRNYGEPSLMWLRAFHEVYNPSMAPRVLALLTQEFPDIHLTMVGPDKGDGSLRHTQAVASELGVAEHLSYPGGVLKTDVPAWLEKGSIFLNTTNIDNTPVSVMEAMASGLCVVSTNVGGIPYLLKDGHDAILVPPNDPQAMAAAIRRILVEQDLAEHLSLNARQKAEQFDWAVLLPQWKTLFTYILSQKGHNVESR